MPIWHRCPVFTPFFSLPWHSSPLCSALCPSPTGDPSCITAWVWRSGPGTGDIGSAGREGSGPWGVICQWHSSADQPLASGQGHLMAETGPVLFSDDLPALGTGPGTQQALNKCMLRAVSGGWMPITTGHQVYRMLPRARLREGATIRGVWWWVGNKQAFEEGASGRALLADPL